MRQMLTNLDAMHRTGIVHRDVKPQNMILSPDGLRMIDLGAGADLRVGINYIPNEYLLDPRFAPPQQYVMSPLTPRYGPSRHGFARCGRARRPQRPRCPRCCAPAPCVAAPAPAVDARSRASRHS